MRASDIYPPNPRDARRFHDCSVCDGTGRGLTIAYRDPVLREIWYSHCDACGGDGREECRLHLYDCERCCDIKPAEARTFCHQVHARWVPLWGGPPPWIHLSLTT